jgi:hypothetical protein
VQCGFDSRGRPRVVHDRARAQLARIVMPRVGVSRETRVDMGTAKLWFKFDIRKGMCGKWGMREIKDNNFGV